MSQAQTKNEKEAFRTINISCLRHETAVLILTDTWMAKTTINSQLKRLFTYCSGSNTTRSSTFSPMPA